MLDMHHTHGGGGLLESCCFLSTVTLCPVVYEILFESVLTFYITSWYNFLSVKNRPPVR